jgi:hypothetical protein
MWQLFLALAKWHSAADLKFPTPIAPYRKIIF